MEGGFEGQTLGKIRKQVATPKKRKEKKAKRKDKQTVIQTLYRTRVQ